MQKLISNQFSRSRFNSNPTHADKPWWSSGRTLLLVGRLVGALLFVVVVASSAYAETAIKHQFDMRPGGTVEVDVESSSIEVVGTNRDGVRLTIYSKYADPEDKFEFDFRANDDRVVIRAEKRNKGASFWSKWSGRYNLRFVVEVPRDSSLELDTSGGKISATDVTGSVVMDTSGGSIRGESLGRDVNADTSGGSITLTDIGGNVLADTSGGSIQIENVNGTVRADTSGGSIRIEDVTGDVSADTSGGSIKIDNVGGYVKADTSGGTVTVTFVAGNHRGGELSTSGGGVRAYVDEGANLDIDAQASGGSVICEVPVTIHGKISKSRVKGKLGRGGSLLRLRSSGGTVKISPL